MKPATAAKKLGVLLDATPADFREGVVSRDDGYAGSDLTEAHRFDNSVIAVSVTRTN